MTIQVLFLLMHTGSHDYTGTVPSLALSRYCSFSSTQADYPGTVPSL